MGNPEELLVKAERLKYILSSHATGGSGDDGEYQLIRGSFLRDPTIKAHLPRFVHSCRNLGDFWAFIKPKFSTYAERRAFLAEELEPLLSKLEGATGSPAVDSSTVILSVVDSAHVQEAWQKAMDRRLSDPEGAVTTARTLLETVCKYILDEQGIEYDDSADLPKLYRAVSESLNLAPSQHTEEIVKRILGGCCSVVEGLGAFRSRSGDAHGKGKHVGKPKPRHAALAVNLAGSVSSFLIETYAAKASG